MTDESIKEKETSLNSFESQEKSLENTLQEKDKNSKKSLKISSQSLEYGVCRGIDFKNVKSVINFDLPKSSKSYSHRIGRTGRGDNKGYSLTFYTPGANVSCTKKDLKISQDKVFARIEKVQKGNFINLF